MSVVTTGRNDMVYCPGCSHGLLLERLGAALARIGRPPEQVCLVTDIGCIGTADRYFACHTFHGLHGRSFTYAEGIWRALPELLVVVLVGDGGCGIGTGHLVHAARRNAGIKVLVANNFNFGMTGGQHSPTTPALACTSTTPHGAVDRPFDVCGTVMASSGGYVARCSVLDEVATDRIEAALRAPGFALVDLWELCVAYYMPSNKLTPPGLLEMSERLGMPFGVLQEPSTGTTPSMAAVIPPADADDAESVAAPPLRWPQRAEVCVAGSAGQRIRSAAGVLGEIAVAGGLHAVQQDDFPITVRKGHSISNLIVDAAPIDYIALDHPQLVVILSDDGATRLGPLDKLEPSCLVLAARGVTLPTTPARVVVIDVDQLGRSVGRASAALAATAAGVVLRGWITGATLLAAAGASLTGRFREANLKAIAAGVDLADATVPAAR